MIQTEPQHKYSEVAEDILRRIESGELAPGARLPGVRALGEQFACNYHTVRHAFTTLARQGYLEMKTGSGTFVTRKAVDYLKRKVATEKVLRTTGRLGVLLPLNQWGEYGTSLINQLHHAAAKQNLELNIRSVGSIDIQTASLASEFYCQDCCAIIIPWIAKDQHAAGLHDFVRASELPVVLPEQFHGLENYSYRMPEQPRKDSPNSIALCGRYFLSLGYRYIAMLGAYDDSPEHLRCKVVQYLDWVSRENLPTLFEMVEDASGRDMDRVIDRWLPQKGRLAVIAHHDDLALEFIDACRKRGLGIPQDFAVMGHNNNPRGVRTDPRLSTILCPYEHIADGMVAHALALSLGSSAQLKGPDPHEIHISETCGGSRK
jgi:DNA-binding LacI/PurR family transcriptional regulator